MALPYPEGAVYFRRTALRLPSSPWNFDVQNDQTFYSHCLIENVWNPWAYNYGSSVPSASSLATHPRSRVVVGKGQWYATHFGVWDKTTIMFSDEQNGRNFFHRIELENNQNFNEVRDFDSSRLLKTILRPVPMANAKYMLIDWVNPFRAIYFPLAHQAGPGYEDLCVYLMIDFRLRQGVEMLSPTDGRWLSLKFDRERGLDYRHTDVMSFDLKGIYNYLILPQQLRNPEKGLYRTQKRGDELVTMFNCNEPTTRDLLTTITRPFARELDLVSVINDNFGVDVTWQPYQYSSWVVNFLTHVIEIGLGFIPVVGPLMAVSFSVGLQIITDPDAFRSENILQLSADIVAALISSGMDVRSNLPKSHQSSGTKLIVVTGLPEENTELSNEEAEIEGRQIPEQETVTEEEKAPEQEVKDEGKDTPDQEAKEEEDEGIIPEQEAKDGVDNSLEPEAKEKDKETPAQETREEEGESSQLEAKEEEKNSEDQKTAEEGEHNAEQGTKDEGKEISEQKAVDEGKQIAEQEAMDEGKQTSAQEAKEDGEEGLEQEPKDEGEKYSGQETKEEGGETSAQAAKDEETQTSGQEAKEGGEETSEVKDEGEKYSEQGPKDEGKETSEQETKDEEPQTSAEETKEDGKEVPEHETKDEDPQTSSEETKEDGKEVPEHEVKEEEKNSEQDTKDQEPPSEQETEEDREKSSEQEPKDEGKETSERENQDQEPPSEQGAKDEENQAE